MRRRRKRKTITGIIQKTRQGFAFLIPEDKSEDVFISARNTGDSMNGDKVVASFAASRRKQGSREGEVLKILERRHVEIVGTFTRNNRYGFVTPDDRKLNEDVFVSKRDFSRAKDGDKVVVKISKYPSARNSAEGKIIEVIGSDEKSGLKSLIISHGVKEVFPRKVLSEAGHIPKAIKDIKGRRDLRNEMIFTIDGADSKDFDDAVSVRRLANGNALLGVHIADVTAYVKEDSYLDKEAFARGTSIYLIDAVIPMLPVELSNGICSLNEGVDRFTLSVDMEINPKGIVVRNEIYESVINSKARLIYDDVSDFLEDDLPLKPEVVQASLLEMDELAKVLRGKKEERGSIDFDMNEAVIRLNSEGVPVDVSISERRTANRLIEEFMLLANEVVAEKYYFSRLPFLYRVHEKPEEDRLQEFNDFLATYGLSVGKDPSPMELNGILEKVKGKPMENAVTTLMLRSMKKAFYSTECMGHFGLALKYYSHFTSPIRRYPDLMIHRVIKENLKGKISDKRKEALRLRTGSAAEQSSRTEMVALELEREYEKMKKAEFMSYHLGEEFDGVVSGVTSFGIFVELENTVEGLIAISELRDDIYIFEKEQYRLRGEMHGKIYRIGDEVRVQVAKADKDLREIDFRLL